MEEDIYRSQFRLPYSLYELLKASADENHRSVNAELVSRLESTFSKRDAVRRYLGMPLEENEDDQVDLPALIPPTKGVSKALLVKSANNKKIPISDDLRDVIGCAVQEALEGVIAAWGDQDGKKPQPNTGPKPRKIRPSR